MFTARKRYSLIHKQLDEPIYMGVVPHMSEDLFDIFFLLEKNGISTKKTRAFPASLFFFGGERTPQRRKKSLLRQHRYILIGHPMRGSAAFEFAG